MSSQAVQLTRAKYGRLTPQSYGHKGRFAHGYCWECRCDCGRTAYVRACDLEGDKVVSCGCRRKAVLADRSTKHGGAGTRLHHIWKGLRARCNNPEHTVFDYYGGRGVRVCRGWDDFAAFRADVGDPPSKAHSLDRIETAAGHYSCGKCPECVTNGWPMNVRWATRVEQARNKSNNFNITFGDQTKTLAEWAEVTGIPRTAIRSRIRDLEMLPERALTQPYLKRVGRKSMRLVLQQTRINMIYRCHVPENRQFKDYGGRGITVCARWLGSVQHFVDDVGPRPKGRTLDRIDNAKGYWCGRPECPECGPLGREPNCRWATRKTQGRNRRPRTIKR